MSVGNKDQQKELEGARESAYLRQVNFYSRPLFEKILRGHIRTVPGNMRAKFEVRSLIAAIIKRKLYSSSSSSYSFIKKLSERN